MGNVSWTKHSFAAGELSHKICQSRSDLKIHSQGVSKCQNLIPLSVGSLIALPELIKVSDCKLPTDASRIIPFNLVNGVYVLCVFGEQEVVILNLGSAENLKPQEVTSIRTPYHFGEASQLEFAVFGSLMVLVHRSHPPCQILCKDGVFSFSEMKFFPPPWLADNVKEGIGYQVDLSIKKAQDDSKLFEISSDFKLFSADDTGRYLRFGCLPSARKSDFKYPENSFMVSDGKVYQSKKGGLSSENPFTQKEGTIYAKDGEVTWIEVASFGIKNSSESGSNSFFHKSPSLLSPYFIWGEIKEVFNDGKKVLVLPKSKHSFLSGEKVVSWNFSAWTRNNGYPQHVSFYQNRLVFSGGKDDELSVYLSSYDSFNDFSIDGEYGCFDLKKALTMAVTDTSVSEIKWLHPFGGGILVGCDTSLWLLSISYTQGLSVDFRRISGSGVYSCPPVSASDYLFFVYGAGRRVKAVTGSTEQGFKFVDLSIFVDHLFTHSIKGLSYQEEPYSLLWVYYDSQPYMSGCLFNPEEENFAWHIHNLEPGQYFKSLASFPSEKHGDTSVWILTEVCNEEGNCRPQLGRLGIFTSEETR
ncbi:hypothetical protein [Candidatus Liberibacter americanus]|uniref:Uncharacterized protein n=1 Tax=Candidatus Liberibacter americanus str. Sao Paulo TaxID=1261131 RepID=U6B5I6_9HYPH|nr:hypothetical protein [Candidatus Liberibacter americanus]AHA28023.1 hypothetical protein lam_677 [Candidatus Liberibacter americanus str. Sao Paulo]EMS35823.1 hypothetical protein G653_04651 [Candidatus Liberibacter americanus PW_SP]